MSVTDQDRQTGKPTPFILMLRMRVVDLASGYPLVSMLWLWLAGFAMTE